MIMTSQRNLTDPFGRTVFVCRATMAIEAAAKGKRKHVPFLFNRPSGLWELHFPSARRKVRCSKWGQEFLRPQKPPLPTTLRCPPCCLCHSWVCFCPWNPFWGWLNRRATGEPPFGYPYFEPIRRWSKERLRAPTKVHRVRLLLCGSFGPI